MGNLRSTFKRLVAKRALVVAGAVVLSVGGVAGIAYALTSGGPSTAGSAGSTSGSSSSSGSTSGTPTGASAQSGAAKGKGAVSRLGSLIDRAVHAEVVVAKAGGGYETIDLDRGTVSAVSSTSVTVSPLDGAAPVTATITSSTHEPKSVTISEGEQVILISSDGNALLLRPDTKATSGTSGSSGSSATGSGASTGQVAAS